MTASVKAGLGKHAYELTGEQQAEALMLSTIASPFGIMAYSLPNISVAIFLDRILLPDRLRKWLIYSVVIAQNLAAAVCAVLLFVQCSTPQFFWHGTCLSPSMVTSYSYFAGGMMGCYGLRLSVLTVI
jgi:amino acid transporter